MNVFLTLLIFFLGTAIGSFLSVLIHRYKEKKNFVMGRSMCPHCKTNLKALDLVPLASFLLLKGRCRFCEKEISPHYFYIELLTGLLLALLFIKFPFFQFLEIPPYQTFDVKTLVFFLNYAATGIFLIAIFFYDLLFREIPDAFSLPPIAIAFVGGLLTGTPTWQDMLIGGAAAGIFFQGQIMISKGRWLGDGDTRLGILMGILLGWKLLLVAIFFAYAFGACISIYLLAAKKATAKTAIAFGPYLVSGTFFAIFMGEYVLNWYTGLLQL